MVLKQVKCYERFNPKKLYQRADLSITQSLALRSSQIHFKMFEIILFNGSFIIPLVRFSRYLYMIHI